MAFKKLELSKPSISTERRLVEIEFVMVINTINKGFKREDAYDIIQMICRATETDINLLFIAYNNLQKLNRKPSKLEMILLYRFKGFSLAEIKKLTGITPNTQTAKVSYYISEDEPDLIPQLLLPNVHDELAKFLKGYHERLGKASLLTKKAGEYENYEIL